MKTRKCKSYCSLQEPRTCLYPKCILSHSTTRKTYCRIPPTHKLTPQCDVVSRKEESLSQMKRTPTYLMMGDSGECVAFGHQAYTWWEFFREYTSFKYVEDVYPVHHEHELLYLNEGLVSYARLKSTPHSFYEYTVGTRYINRVLHRFPCFLYTYGLYYLNAPAQKMYRKRQLQATLVQHGLECLEDNAYLLVQHLHDSVPLSSVSLKERLPLLFIIYHALAELSSSFTHNNLIMKNVMVWRPHPTKYITYKYPGITFQSPYVPKIVNFNAAYFSHKDDSTETVSDLCKYTYNAQLNPNKDVSLIRDAYPDLKLTGVSVQQVYRLLKKLVPSTEYESIGTMTVRKTVTYVAN